MTFVPTSLIHGRVRSKRDIERSIEDLVSELTGERIVQGDQDAHAKIERALQLAVIWKEADYDD